MTKIRIVYDVYDLLETGPSLMPDISTILLKFHLHPIAIVAGTEKAFLQILLKEDDRDLT